jgi:hypothetical protein
VRTLRLLSLPPVAAAALLLAGSVARADDLSADGLVKTGIEIDTNPSRLSGASPASETDVVERLYLELGLSSAQPAMGIGASARIGLKRFHETREEDALVADLSVGATRRLWDGGGLALSLSARHRGERGHIRDYVRLGASLALVWEPGPLRLRAGPEVGWFLYRPDPELSSTGPGAGFELGWQIVEAFRVQLGYRFQLRYYDQRQVASEAGTLRLVESAAREDVGHTGGLTFALETSFLARLELFVQRNDSNSFGKSLTRFGGRLATTFSLPGEVFLHGTASVQRTSFDDEVLIDPTFGVDDENRNAFEVSLSRDVWRWLGAEVRYSLYLQEFGGDDAAYERHLIYAGLVATL